MNATTPKRGPRSGMPIPEHVLERVFTRYEENEDGCWISGYHKMGKGYAVITTTIGVVGKRQQGFLAHRVAWTALHGPIPAGMVIDHKCFTRACINPDHLRLFTHEENARRQNGVDFTEGTCRRGHPESERVDANWARNARTYCRSCARERAAERKARLEAA